MDCPHEPSGRRVAMREVDLQTSTSTVYYLLSDHLGSSTLLLNSSGGEVSGGPQRYYPFGRGFTGTVNTDKKFTGHQAEGPLYYMKARFYDPTLGRFMSGDPVAPSGGDPQALNRYSYV